MESKKEFIKRTVQLESDAFIYQGGAQAEAAAINPNIWDSRLRDYEEKSLIITNIAEQFDFRGAGVDFKVTVDDRPAAAGALVETTDVAVVAFTTRSVTFTPLEYGVSYQITRQEAVRAFFNVAERMVRKLGYALAEKKDKLAETELRTGATSTYLVNGKAATTDLASTDVLNLAAISEGAYAVRSYFYKPKWLVINAFQEHKLRTGGGTISLTDASQFGTREMMEKGFVGRIFGLDVVVSDNIEASSHITYALVVGVSKTGESALGYAIKRDPIIEREYHARGRYWDIVAHEEYSFELLHPDAVCKIGTYQ